MNLSDKHFIFNTIFRGKMANNKKKIHKCAYDINYMKYLSRCSREEGLLCLGQTQKEN